MRRVFVLAAVVAAVALAATVIAQRWFLPKIGTVKQEV